ALEVVLGHPEAVVAEPVHQHGHGLGLAERARKMRVRIAPRVDRRAAVTDVVEIGVAGVEAGELCDHGVRVSVGAGGGYDGRTGAAIPPGERRERGECGEWSGSRVGPRACLAANYFGLLPPSIP